jgi:hypothetical protein
MESLVEFVKLVTALVVLATAIIKLLSAAGVSNDREDKEEGR